MKFLKTLFFLAILLALFLQTIHSATQGEENPSPSKNGEASRVLSSFRQRHYRYGRHFSCFVNPRICRMRGSPGKTCCYWRCVDLKSDAFNCGRCGRRCRYWETCCKGKCVNIMFNRKHCGNCFNKCKPGNWCVYGMCNYA